jgi:histidine ammonia-lyase
MLDGSGLTVEKLVSIARDGEKVGIHPEALERINICRAMLEEKIQAREIMYGVNTGIGEFSEVVLTDDQVEQFQRYLIYNHAAGIGDPTPIEYVRQQRSHPSSMPKRLGRRLWRPGSDVSNRLIDDG